MMSDYNLDISRPASAASHEQPALDASPQESSGSSRSLSTLSSPAHQPETQPLLTTGSKTEFGVESQSPSPDFSKFTTSTRKHKTGKKRKPTIALKQIGRNKSDIKSGETENLEEDYAAIVAHIRAKIARVRDGDDLAEGREADDGEEAVGQNSTKTLDIARVESSSSESSNVTQSPRLSRPRRQAAMLCDLKRQHWGNDTYWQQQQSIGEDSRHAIITGNEDPILASDATTTTIPSDSQCETPNAIVGSEFKVHSRKRTRPSLADPNLDLSDESRVSTPINLMYAPTPIYDTSSDGAPVKKLTTRRMSTRIGNKTGGADSTRLHNASNKTVNSAGIKSVGAQLQMPSPQATSTPNQPTSMASTLLAAALQAPSPPLVSPTSQSTGNGYAQYLQTSSPFLYPPIAQLPAHLSMPLQQLVSSNFMNISPFDNNILMITAEHALAAVQWAKTFFLCYPQILQHLVDTGRVSQTGQVLVPPDPSLSAFIDSSPVPTQFSVQTMASTRNADNSNPNTNNSEVSTSTVGSSGRTTPTIRGNSKRQRFTKRRTRKNDPSDSSHITVKQTLLKAGADHQNKHITRKYTRKRATNKARQLFMEDEKELAMEGEEEDVFETAEERLHNIFKRLPKVEPLDDDETVPVVDYQVPDHYLDAAKKLGLGVSETHRSRHHYQTQADGELLSSPDEQTFELQLNPVELILKLCKTEPEL